MVEGKTAGLTRNRFTIPVFPHVKKFILKNTKASGVIKVEEYTVLGKLVTLALRENPVGAKNNDAYRDRVTDSITIQLSKKQTDLGPRLSKLMRINVDVDRVFKDHLLTSIYSLSEAGIPPYQACRMFLERYSIDENEYSSDAAYRFYQRSKCGKSKTAIWTDTTYE